MKVNHWILPDKYTRNTYGSLKSTSKRKKCLNVSSDLNGQHKVCDVKQERNKKYSISCTCCNITHIPNSQAVPLSSKGISEGLIRAAWSAEQHTLFTGNKHCYNTFKQLSNCYMQDLHLKIQNNPKLPWLWMMTWWENVKYRFRTLTQQHFSIIVCTPSVMVFSDGVKSMYCKCKLLPFSCPLNAPDLVCSPKCPRS